MTSRFLYWVTRSIRSRVILPTFLLCSAFASTAVGQSNLDSRECAELLKNHVEALPKFSKWENLPAKLEKIGRAAVLVRVPLIHLTLPASDLLQPSWIEDTGVHYISEFATLTHRGWYFIVEGQKDKLLKLHKILPKQIGETEAYFEILRRFESPSVLQLPIPVRMLEVPDTAAESPKTTDYSLNEELRLHPDNGLAVYDRGIVSMAIPKLQAESLPESVLVNFGIQATQLSKDEDLVSSLHRQNENPLERRVLITSTHWIFSPAAFSMVKTLEGNELPPDPPSLEMVRTWFEAQPVDVPAVAATAVPATAPPVEASTTISPQKTLSSEPGSILTESDVAFLTANEMHKQMLETWNDVVELRWKRVSYIENSLDVMSRKFLSAESAKKLKTLRAQQQQTSTEGQLLYRTFRGDRGSLPALLRFAELWKTLSVEIQPEAFDPAFTNASVQSTIDLLKTLKSQQGPKKPTRPLAKVVQNVMATASRAVADLASPITSKLTNKTEIPETKVVLPNESVSPDSIRDLAAFVMRQNSFSWYAPDSSEAHFTMLLKKLVGPDELEKLKKEIAEIGFHSRDGGNARIPGKAQRKTIKALKILAGAMEPSWARASVNAKWVDKVIREYERRFPPEKYGEEKAEPKVEPKVEKETEKEKAKDPYGSGNFSEIIKGHNVSPSVLGTNGQKQVQFEASRPVEVRFGSEVKGYNHLLTSPSFKDFVRNYAHLAVNSILRPGEKALIYFEPGPDRPLLFNFKVSQDTDKGAQQIEITAIDKIDAENESKVYAAIAKRHAIAPWEFRFSGGRNLQVGPLSVTALQISGKVYAKLQVKHRMSEGEIARVLNKIRKLQKENGSYMSVVEDDGNSYVVYVEVTNGEVSLKTLYQKDVGKPQPVGRH